MFSEGKNYKVNDLKPIKVKKIKPAYRLSNHKLIIRPKKKAWLGLSLAILVVFVLCALVYNSFFFRVLALAYSLKGQNILIGFQNSAELRPTGGFWGSFGILKVKDKITNSELVFETNPYKKDNPLLLKSSEALPKPMSETYPGRNQSFVNANWQVDFPKTAKDLEWFLSEGWGEQVNGTIAISSLAIIDLLKETGPIKVDDIEVTSENFTQIMSEKIDKEYWQNPDNKVINEPKTILKDLSPILLKKAKSLGYYRLYKFSLFQAKQGRILAFFSNQRQEKLVKKIGISGENKSYNLDYLQVSNANLNGGKSSLNVTQSINYEVKKSETKPLAKLTITRKLNDNWPNILNRNYTRVFVPLGSEILSANIDGKDITESTDISQEEALTCFGTWFSVSPGDQSVLTYEYFLPFDNENLKKYNLIYQKQPGTLADELKITLGGGELFNSVFKQTFKEF